MVGSGMSYDFANGIGGGGGEGLCACRASGGGRNQWEIPDWERKERDVVGIERGGKVKL